MSRSGSLKIIGLAFLGMGLCVPLAMKAKAELSSEEAQRVKAVAQQALKSDPNNADHWLRLGIAHHSLGDVDSAQSAFEKSTALNPRNADAYYMLGLIYEKKRMTAEALRAWRAVEDHTQDDSKRDVAQKHIHHLSRQ